MFKLFLLIILSCIAACQPADDQRYQVKSIGNAERTTSGTVLSVEDVYIQRQNSGAGAFSGAAAGGLVSSASSDNAFVIIAGVTAGAILGSTIESSTNQLNAKQYVIRTESERLLTVAQIDEGNEIFQEDDSVLLIYGYPHRLIASPF